MSSGNQTSARTPRCRMGLFAFIAGLAAPMTLKAQGLSPREFPTLSVRRIAARLSAKLRSVQRDQADEVHVVIGLIAHDQTAILLDGELDETDAGDWLFPVASLTKPLTATLLAISVAKGDLRLDAPVRDDGRLETITWLDLATHRSGLPRLSDFNEDRQTPLLVCRFACDDLSCVMRPACVENGTTNTVKLSGPGLRSPSTSRA